MGIIKGYPEGSDITVLNTDYHYPHKKEDGKYTDGDITIVYKDNRTGKKHFQVINNPDYTFYAANDDVLVEHPVLYIERDKVHPVTVPYKNLDKKIAELTGNEDFYYENIRNGNRRNNRELHYLPNIFGSTMSVENHYRYLFNEQYVNNPFKIKKAYFDIEADTINMDEDFPRMGECPINAISYINESTNIIHSFLLRTKGNPLIKEFENEVKSGKIFNEVKEFITNAVTPKLARKYGLEDFEVKFHFYDEDDEIRLIQDFFLLVNLNEPDFLVAWNMAFDIPYIVDRINILGYDPREIMCHRDIKPEFRHAKYYIDTRAETFAERGDYYDISSHTVYLDQLIQFASRRKGQKELDSYKLDDVGDVIAKVRKLDYSHITTNISKLPYLDYKTFVFYNIMDTIVQKCIESKVKDLDYVFGKSLAQNTDYSKVHRQTVYLTNRAYSEWLKDGLVIGNGKGIQEKVPFPGALVSQPLNNSDYSKMKFDRQTVDIVDNMCDFDYKALYPTTACQNNMGPNTQIGKIKIEQKVFEKENPFNNKFYDRGGQFIEDYTSGDALSFGNRWLHLGTYTEILDDVTEFFTVVIPNAQHIRNGMQNGMSYQTNALMPGMQYLDEGEYMKGMLYYPGTMNKKEVLENIKW